MKQLLKCTPAGRAINRSQSLFSPARLINSIKHEHSCEIPYVSLHQIWMIHVAELPLFLVLPLSCFKNYVMFDCIDLENSYNNFAIYHWINVGLNASL